MSEDVSLISMHPFFRGFVLSAIQVIRARNFVHEEKIVIDADLVPKVSEKVMAAAVSLPLPVVEKVEPKPVVVKRDMSELVAPIRRPHKVQVVAPEQVVMPPVRADVEQVSEPTQGIVAPVVVADKAVGEDGEYGKLGPLLNDPSISTIECSGEDKELMIIRAGQRQRTRISLNRVEIQEILNRVADEAHIPLIEGVFRASVKGFSVSAVVSEMIGSKFLIKKVTAYNLLE